MKISLSLESLLYEKARKVGELEVKLGDRALRAQSDYHARKPPRPCGLTVHSVVGCTFACTYCYLPDMGIDFEHAKPYWLDSIEMSYALLKNPYFLPGLYGTYLALGSIGEPLHPVGLERTLSYLQAFHSLLGNPVQFSTKIAVTRDLAKRIAAVNPLANPLVTIITLNLCEKLERSAPPPYARLRGIKELRRAGLAPMLFLRPLIPGIKEDDIFELLSEAKRYGAVGVVVGGLRITPAIVNRLKPVGFDVSEILKRTSRELKPGVQVPVNVNDLKRKVVNMAKELGLVPLLSACCALTYSLFLTRSVRIPCMGLDFVTGKFCAGCPVRCQEIEVVIDEEEVRRLIARLIGVKVAVEVSEVRIILKSSEKGRLRRQLRRKRWVKFLLEVGYRKKVLLG